MCLSWGCGIQILCFWDWEEKGILYLCFFPKEILEGVSWQQHLAPPVLSPGVCPTHWTSPLWRFTFMLTRHLKFSEVDGHKYLGKECPAEDWGRVSSALIVLNSSLFKATSWLWVLQVLGKTGKGFGEQSSGELENLKHLTRENVSLTPVIVSRRGAQQPKDWECFPASSGGHRSLSCLFVQSLWLCDWQAKISRARLCFGDVRGVLGGAQVPPAAAHSGAGFGRCVLGIDLFDCCIYSWWRLQLLTKAVCLNETKRSTN